MSNSNDGRESGFGAELDDEVAALLEREDGAERAGASEDAIEEARRATSSNGAPRGAAAVLEADDIANYRERWTRVQTGFIDDPHRAVEQADHLVDVIIQRLVDRLTAERDDLVQRWDGQTDPSTEDLRQALQGYRQVMDRLLAL